MQNSGDSRRGNVKLYNSVIARSSLVRRSPPSGEGGCDEAIQSFFAASGLLRFARNDGAEGLATQLTLLVDGSIAQDLVRNDPAMARAGKEAAKVLLANAGIGDGGRKNPAKRQRVRRPSS